MAVCLHSGGNRSHGASAAGGPSDARKCGVRFDQLDNAIAMSDSEWGEPFPAKRIRQSLPPYELKKSADRSYQKNPAEISQSSEARMMRGAPDAVESPFGVTGGWAPQFDFAGTPKGNQCKVGFLTGMPEFRKLQSMTEGRVQTSWEHADISNCVVGAAQGTIGSAFQVRRHVCQGDRCIGCGFGFQRPLLLRTVNLVQVIDTGIHLSGGTRFDEVWDSDGG
jgi:hypothetical protein